MLDREGESLDLQPVRVAQETIQVDTQGMRRQFGPQPRTQPPERMRMVGLDPELLRQLSVDRLDDLTRPVQGPGYRGRELLLHVAPRQRQQPNPVLLPQVRSFGGANVGLVSQDGQVRMFAQ